MTLTVRIDAALTFDVTTAGDIALCIGATAPRASETITADTPGGSMHLTELLSDGGRIHLIDSPAGTLTLAYRAEVDIPRKEAARVDRLEALVYLRPSRYCPSDQLAGLASAEFGSLTEHAAAVAVEQWLHDTLTYSPGATDATDGALHPLLARTGVCRDYAHLGVAVCRALGLPARYVAAYAPGLDPMDFHAVYEVAIDGRWWVFDGTRLAPRQSLVRIATGRDAADCALLTPVRARVGTVSHDLTVTTESELPFDDRNQLVVLA